MNSTLFLGTYPGLTEAMIQREVDVILAFAEQSLANQQDPAESLS